MKLRALGALLALAAMASMASAANVVIWSVNTGQTTNPTQGTMGTNSPQSTPGAKGFLLAIDFSMDGLGEVFTAVQDFEVMGPIVQWQDPIYASDNALPNDDVQERSHALLVNADGQDMPPGASNFLREDSYWWDSNQTVAGQAVAWNDLFIEDGTPGDGKMTYTGQLGSTGTNVGQGIARLIYVVTTGDLEIRGVIARTADPQNATDPGGGPVGSGGYVVLHFDTMTLEYVPEPSSFVLAGLGVVALAFGAWRRRK